MAAIYLLLLCSAGECASMPSVESFVYLCLKSVRHCRRNLMDCLELRRHTYTHSYCHVGAYSGMKAARMSDRSRTSNACMSTARRET